MWNVFAIVFVAGGLVFFSLPIVLRIGPSGATGRVSLPGVALVILITALLVIVHEAIHGTAMRSFGAHPKFGVVLVGQVMPALYATSEGHLFTRFQYLVVALSPAVIISVLGFLACFSQWAGYLVIPLAVHLGGCAGDAAATWQVTRKPSGTLFEDLRDGLRFHGPE